eukprot:jgi/Botrbrau1/9376/Bobra.0252s0005.3
MMRRCITGREACQAILPMTTLLLILVVAEASKSNGFSQVRKQEHFKRAADDSITEVPVLGRSLGPGLSAVPREDESYLAQTHPSAGQHVLAKESPKPSGAHLVQEAVHLMGDRKLSRSLRVAPPRQANIEDEPGMLGGPVRQAEIENSFGIVGGPASQGDIENAPGMFGGSARQSEIEGAPGVVGGPRRQAEMEDAPGMLGGPPRQGEIEDGPGMLEGPITLSTHNTLPEGKSGAAVGLVTSDRPQSVSSRVHPGRTVLQEQGRTAGCRIYVLDLADIAVEMGVHICNIEDVVADHITQVPFLRSYAEAKEYVTGSHVFSANAGPWFLYEALQNSPARVQEPELANIVYVHDYCYKMWWLAHIHSEKSPQEQQAPGSVLLALYKHMIQMPLWKKYGGRNFVFFESHTGFATYDVGTEYEAFLCNELGSALHFVNTRAVRYRCAKYNESDFVIVPPSFHYHDIVKHRKRVASSKHARPRSRRRAVLVFFRGKCTPATFVWDNNSPNRGKIMRLETMRALANSAPDVRIECTGDKQELKEEHAKQIVHDEQVALYHNSVYCLVIPGDSQTSRRLPEAVLTGCIPVFYGPPFHTIPLGTDLDYRDFSIAFNLTEPQAWNKNVRVSWNLSMDERANERGPTDARFWIPDVPYLAEWAIQVPNLKAMVQALRKVPAAEVQRLQAGLNAVGSRFLYMPLPSSSGNAKVSLSSLLINHMCRRAEAFKQHAAAG